MAFLSRIHEKTVHSRRVKVLAQEIANLIPAQDTVADIGCGDGQISQLLLEKGKGPEIVGYDVLARENSHIPVKTFDGKKLPLADNSVDHVLLVDVVHHSDDPEGLLKECVRVSKKSVIIKDHRLSRPGAFSTLQFMDYIGNKSYGVNLPNNYWSEQKWRQEWKANGLKVDFYEDSLGLYPWPANWAFEKGLHFLAALSKPESTHGTS